METLTGKERRVKQKAQYDCYKAIKDKIEKGEPEKGSKAILKWPFAQIV